MSLQAKLNADAALLKRYSGKLPYADAMTVLRVPIAVIQDAINGNFEPIKSENGRHIRSHNVIFLPEHPQFPDELADLTNMFLWDWEVDLIAQRSGMTVNQLPMMTSADENDDGTYDCAFLRVAVCQRTIGNMYQFKEKKAFDHKPTERNGYKMGEQHIFTEMSQLDPIRMPKSVTTTFRTEAAKAMAAADQQRINKRIALDEQRKRSALNTKIITAEESEKTRKLFDLEDALAEHNNTLDVAKAELEAATTDAKKKAATAKVAEASSAVESYTEQIKTIKEELEAIKG